MLEFVEFSIFRGISYFELIEVFHEGPPFPQGDGAADTVACDFGELGRGWGSRWGHIWMEVVESGDVDKLEAGKEFFSLELGVSDWRLFEM